MNQNIKYERRRKMNEKIDYLVLSIGLLEFLSILFIFCFGGLKLNILIGSFGGLVSLLLLGASLIRDSLKGGNNERRKQRRKR